MASERDIVERLRANADKYPGFENLNTEAAATIETLRAEVKAWRTRYESQHSPKCYEGWPDDKCKKCVAGKHIQPAMDATDSTGALGKEGQHGQV